LRPSSKGDHLDRYRSRPVDRIDRQKCASGVRRDKTRPAQAIPPSVSLSFGRMPGAGRCRGVDKRAAQRCPVQRLLRGGRARRQVPGSVRHSSSAWLSRSRSAVPRLSDSMRSLATRAASPDRGTRRIARGRYQNPQFRNYFAGFDHRRPPTSAQARRRVQILVAGGPPARRNRSRSIKMADHGSDKSDLMRLSPRRKLLRSIGGLRPALPGQAGIESVLLGAAKALRRGSADRVQSNQAEVSTDSCPGHDRSNSASGRAVSRTGRHEIQPARRSRTAPAPPPRRDCGAGQPVRRGSGRVTRSAGTGQSSVGDPPRPGRAAANVCPSQNG